MKEIDLTKSLYDLTEEFPELIEVLKGIGFLGVANPVARNTMGRETTVPQGCQKMGLDMAEVVKTLTEAGFEVKPGSLP